MARDKIKVTRDSAGYTFVTVTRRSGGLKASATYRAQMSDYGQTADAIADAHAAAVAAVDLHFDAILGA